MTPAPIRFVRLTLLAALLFGLPAAASAQQLISRPDRPPVESYLRLSGLVFDNFFQAPEGAPQMGVRSGSAEVQVIFPLVEGGSLVHVRGRVVAYDGFDPSLGAGGGLRFVDGPGELEVLAGYDRRLPRFDVGDEFGRADVASASGRYSLRLGPALQVTALGDVGLQFFPDEPTNIKNTFSFDAGGSLRYRGFGYVFSPEIGATAGRLSGVAESEGYDESGFYVMARAIPAPPLYLSARYRLRFRDYIVADPESRNFGREDRRGQISLLASLRTGPRFNWHAHYTLEQASSSRPSRSFQTQYMGIGVAVRL